MFLKNECGDWSSHADQAVLVLRPDGWPTKFCAGALRMSIHDSQPKYERRIAPMGYGASKLGKMWGHLAAKVIVISGLTLSGSAQAESLTQMLYDVYDNNPTIKAEQAGHDASRASTKKAISTLLPQVSATSSYSYAKKGLKAGGSKRTRTSQYGVKASQRLFDGLQSQNNLAKARYEEKSSAYQVRNQERLVLLDAVQTYMDVYAARKMISLRRQHVANMDKQRRGTLARIRAGELTRTDLSKTNALLYRARASLEGARADLGGAAARYEALSGYAPGNLSLPRLPSRYVPKTAGDAERKAQNLHPDLRASRANKKASAHAVKAAKGSFLPTLDLSGEYSRNISSSSSELNRNERTVALRLSLPLFDGGSRLADVQKAKAKHNQNSYRTNALAARIKAEARERFLRNRAAQSSLRQANAEVKAAKDLLRGIRIEEKAGQRSFLDILDAEVSYLDARELEIYAQADSVVALYNLLASTGQLTVSGARKAKLRPDYRATGAIKKARTGSAKQMKPRKISGRKGSDPWSGLR